MNLGTAAILAERGRVNSVEVARAVKGMTSCVYGFGWLRDLYRYVFGFYVEEALKGEDGGASGGDSSGGEGVGSAKGGMAEKLAKRNSRGERECWGEEESKCWRGMKGSESLYSANHHKGDLEGDLYRYTSGAQKNETG